MYTNTKEIDQAMIFLDEQDQTNVGLAIRWYFENGTQLDEAFEKYHMDNLHMFIKNGGDVVVAGEDNLDYYIYGDIEFEDICKITGWDLN